MVILDDAQSAMGLIGKRFETGEYSRLRSWAKVGFIMDVELPLIDANDENVKAITEYT